MYSRNARICFKRTQQFPPKNGARGSGDGNSEIYAFHVRIPFPT